ncbi:hypothetical protein SAMN02745229_01764 [Butyrivibrio fibrisolvens DSM 3071]|jgi:hypothetical protein|uniref:Uncharacterized protein n=1 Tax=Butyrivibrio fibrisolvens DSM 3071 TaxID=1121131 RepID=A0A1M5YVW8_BUTFI|nr:hypothetical protein [Butyrivibrio fibrisolvens]SHI16004.1 hypothetical protein SAMN02745229_01764 [Butyrivibrio fibrisolvens DSM 3071]
MSVKVWPHEVNRDDYFELFEECVENIDISVQAGIKRDHIVRETVNAIKEIVSVYDIDYSEIAVLYPEKDSKGLRYYIQYWLRKALDTNNIPYSSVVPEEDGEGVYIKDEGGVVVASLDAIAGLEFKAVVLTGLYPFSYVFDKKGNRIKLNDWDAIQYLSDENRELIHTYFAKIYKGYLRANEILYVLSDAEQGTIINDVVENSYKEPEEDFDSIIDDILKNVVLC